jgi:hypothetical protein
MAKEKSLVGFSLVTRTLTVVALIKLISAKALVSS